MKDKPGGGNCHLNILPVLTEDEGLYQCKVGSVPGIAAIVSDSAKVTVIVPPGQPYIKQAKLTNILEVLEGEEVELHCETLGAKPEAQIQWKDHNRKVIVSDLLETVTKVTKINETKTFKTVSRLKIKAENNLSLTCSAYGRFA